MFDLTENEFENLRSQLVMSTQHGGTRYKPFAFTEQGVAMLSSVLRSKTAIIVNISIIKAFVMMCQSALSHKELGEKLSKLEEKYNQQFNSVNDVLRYLMLKDQKEKEQIERKRIGFK